MISELLRRLQYLLHRGRFDRELQEDMEFHREMAAREGRNNLGNALRLREEARDAWGWTWIDRLIQDVRYGTRMMSRSPGFTLVAVLILAIGIGVNVAVFSLFNMVALKSLPVPDADRLVRLERRSPDSYTSEMSYPSFLFYRNHARTLSAAMAVMGLPPMQIDGDRQGTSISFVTPNYFNELGTQAPYGRMLNVASDDSPSAPPVMVISHGLWQRRFAGDPAVIGRTIHLNKRPVTIVGVAPYSLATLGGQHPDIWMPIAQQPYLIEGSNVLGDFNAASVRMWGRLAPGVTVKAAEQELKRLTNELRSQHPTAVWNKEWIQSSPGGHMQVMQPEMYQVAAMVGVLTLLILGVACSNLGALMLARAVQREREIGIRKAIGASSSRVLRQLFTESLMLASLGALAGLVLGCAALQIALPLLDAPHWLSASPDALVLLFTIAMTFVATIFFGLIPAFQVARGRQHRTTARQILVAGQVAGSCVLLIVASLLVRAAHRALYTDPGFGYERLISVDPQLAQYGYSPGPARSFLHRLQERLSGVPGVRSMSLVLLPPLGHTISNQNREVDGHRLTVYPNWVTPDFFRTMQIPVLLGRTFREGERDTVVVSSSLARRLWPGQNPVGKLVGDGRVKDRVIGVVGDAHFNALSDDDAVEEYRPAGEDQMPGMVLMVRIAGPAQAIESAAKSISEALDPKLFPEVRQIKSLYLNNVRTIGTVAATVTGVGIVAVLLAGVGLLGLVSFTVSQKTKEVAIRTALGASGGSVLMTLLRQFSWPIGCGLLLGTAATALASQVLRRALYGISNLDLLGYGAALTFLLITLALAMLLPARRALRVNVSQALRYE